jgi:hypothetical protein
MPSLNLRRLSAPLLAAAAIGLALAGFDAGLTALFGSRPRWLPPQLFAGSVSQVGARIARIEQLTSSGNIDNARLVSVIGNSAVEQGLDPRILAATDPHRRTWLVLAQGGGSVRELDIYGQELADSALRPRLVFLGLQISMFHSQDECPAAASVSWLDRNYDSLVDCKTLLLYHLTRGIQATLGLPMSAMFLPQTDPWSAPAYRYDMRLPDAAMAYQLNGLKPRLDPRQYESIDRQTAALQALVEKLRRRGAQVIGVLMPETSSFRAMQSPIMTLRFQEAAASVAGAGLPLRVIDLRNAMPDDLFYDYIHLNQRGRERLSELFPSLAP